MMKFFVKDFCETVQARVFIFGMQVGIFDTVQARVVIFGEQVDNDV